MIYLISSTGPTASGYPNKPSPSQGYTTFYPPSHGSSTSYPSGGGSRPSSSASSNPSTTVNNLIQNANGDGNTQRYILIDC